VKIEVERDVLAEAVAWTARALPARPAVPVLAGMRLQAETELTLSSFDYDVSAQARVQCPRPKKASRWCPGAFSLRSPGAFRPGRWISARTAHVPP